MFLRANAFLLFLAPVAFAQQPTPSVPDLRLTSGEVSDVTAKDVCIPGTRRRRVMFRRKYSGRFTENGITSHGCDDNEVDSLISLGLGGSKSIENLWPES